MSNGYEMYFDTVYGLLTFPITPEELSIKVGSNNKTVTLINEGDINILKSPSLIEVDFEARFPMRKYPYSRQPESFQTYSDILKKVKENKKSFRFIVSRNTPNGRKTWDTNILVALEDYEFHESAGEGDDVLVSIKLKQYKEYGVKIIKTNAQTSTRPSTSTSNTSRDTSTKNTSQQTYTVKSGDCLWNIAKRFYGSGSQYTKIYKANKSAIEADAKKHGKKSSSNGHWIWPGLVLTIPSA